MDRILNLIKTTDRHKITILRCKPEEGQLCREELYQAGLAPVNIGKEVSQFISGQRDLKFISLKASDFITQLFKEKKVSPDGLPVEALVLYNLGILFEPTLALNPTKILKDNSKSIAIIIVWEYQVDSSGLLTWSDQHRKTNLDFSEIPVKIVDYEIQRTNTV